jgi:hypothetical protein
MRCTRGLMVLVDDSIGAVVPGERSLNALNRYNRHLSTPDHYLGASGPPNAMTPPPPPPFPNNNTPTHNKHFFCLITKQTDAYKNKDEQKHE